MSPLAALLLCLALASGVHAQGDPSADRLTQFKAVFLYNFAGYVTWPEGRRDGPLVVEIAGSSDVEPLLRDIAAKRKAGDRTMEVRVAADSARIGPCHLLYIPAGGSDRLQALVDMAKGKSVLSVADVPGAALRSEAAISFVVVGGKLKFEINRQMLADAGLRASSHLLRLGILADEGGADPSPRGR